VPTCPSASAPFPAPPSRAAGGFTLIELMLAVAIVAILATIAVGSYSNAVARSRRAAVESYLQAIANRQEQLLIDARAYATSNTSPPLPAITDDVSGHYTVTVSADNSATPPSFLITATPVGRQATIDARCGRLTLDQAGVRTRSGTAALGDCW